MIRSLLARDWRWLLLSALALAILIVPVPISLAAPAERTIHIDAQRFQYTPEAVSVGLGDRVTLEVHATDVVHGLYVDGYDLDVTADPGQTARLTFVADQAGAFRVRCSVTCGALHPFMMGKLTVGANDQVWRMIGLAVLVSLACGWAVNR